MNYDEHIMQFAAFHQSQSSWNRVFIDWISGLTWEENERTVKGCLSQYLSYKGIQR